MKPDEFHRIALSMPEASERAHMGHPDFRADGRIFATLSYPDGRSGVVNSGPHDAEVIVSSAEIRSTQAI